MRVRVSCVVLRIHPVSISIKAMLGSSRYETMSKHGEDDGESTDVVGRRGVAPREESETSRLSEETG